VIEERNLLLGRRRPLGGIELGSEKNSKADLPVGKVSAVKGRSGRKTVHPLRKE